MESESRYTIGAIADACGLHPTTLRKWMNAYHQLQTDADAGDRGARHRRFTLADAVRLRMLAQLVNDLGVESSRAVEAVNAVYELVGKHVATDRELWVLFFDFAVPRYRTFNTLESFIKGALSNRLLSGRIAFELRAETLAAVAALRQASKSDDARTDNEARN